MDVRADDAGDDGGAERVGCDGGERQEVRVPRGDAVRGVCVNMCKLPARDVMREEFWRRVVRGAKL